MILTSVPYKILPITLTLTEREQVLVALDLYQLQQINADVAGNWLHACLQNPLSTRLLFNPQIRTLLTQGLSNE